MKIRLLTVQIESRAGDIEFNIKKIRRLIFEALKEHKNIDLIILPEMWASGWNCAEFNKYSEELYSSKTYNFLHELSLECSSNVIGGSAVLHRENQKDRNSCLIFDRKGSLRGIYDKYHLFSHRGEAEGSYLQEGEAGLLVNLDIGKAGISTCYDIRFPELFRLYAVKNADFIVNMAAWPEGLFYEYETLLHSRAVENQIYCISSCLTGRINEEYRFSGHSEVCSYRGRTIAALEREEAALCCEISLDEMREYRRKMPVLNDVKKEYKIREIE